MAPLDAITLNGMRFHVLVGVLPHEREHRQPLEIDLTAWVRPANKVLDYRRLYDQVQRALDAAELRYIEDVAQAVADHALAEPQVHRVRVVVRKPHAALGGPLNFAGVSIVRERDA